VRWLLRPSRRCDTVAFAIAPTVAIFIATTTQPGPRGLRSKQYRFSKRTRRRYYDSIFDSPLRVGLTLQPKLIVGGSPNNCLGRTDGFKVDTTLVKMALVLSGFSPAWFSPWASGSGGITINGVTFGQSLGLLLSS
jgi:hypothetical protein